MTVCNETSEVNGSPVTCDKPQGHNGPHSEAFPHDGGKTHRVQWSSDSAGRFVPEGLTS
jgi:hypothetical protein